MGSLDKESGARRTQLPAMSQLTSPSKNAESAQNRPPVLLIFKDDLVRTMLAQDLAGQYRVTAVTNREAAFKHLASGSYDALLMDDDFDVFKSLRAHAPAAHLPVIMVAATSSKQTMLRALEAGVNDYLTWPPDADVLRARLRGLVALKQRSDSVQQTAARVKTASERKDRFMHIVTHDLKNPLNSIKLAHYVLRNLLADHAEAAEPLHTIETTVNSMNELITDFLDSAALENGKTQLQPEPIIMEDAIWEVIYRYGVTANAKNITLLMGETEGVALADPKRLTQILTNLVSNAIKYSPHDRFVTIASTAQGDFVRLSISDEGPGIAESERSALFEPFARTSSRPTGGESSTGLGLWIVKELVTLHGGKLGYDAPPGGGSTFWVELPAYIEMPQEIAV